MKIGFIFIVILVFIALLVMFLIGTYNGLVKLRNWVKESWAQIDVQLKRRYDLIPNLINTVKGYATHEKETLDAVIQARNGLTSGSPQDRMDADNELQATLKTVFALTESYPDLKANESFLKLQEELAPTENQVAYSRQLYNKTVAEYNIKRETFPAVLFAGMLGFKPESQLTIPESERAVPKVEF